MHGPDLPPRALLAAFLSFASSRFPVLGQFDCGSTAGQYCAHGVHRILSYRRRIGLRSLGVVGIGVLTFRHPAYRFARICSWAGAALFVSIAIVWGATTKESAKVWIPTVAFIGAVGAVGLTGALRAINSAELQLAQSDKAAQTSNGAPNFNFQGPSTNTFNLSREPQQQTENAAREEIYQAGISVGKVFGGRRSPTNATIFEFQEITQAGQFNLGAEFEYQDYVLKPLHIQTVTGLNISRPQCPPSALVRQIGWVEEGRISGSS
jgi:hypothetical protein